MNVKCSTTLTSEDSTDRELARQWNHFPWDTAHSYVNRLQTRIAKAVKEGKTRLAKRLQYILTHSYFAKALAVKKVTENKGSATRSHMKDCTKPSYPFGMSLPQHA